MNIKTNQHSGYHENITLFWINIVNCNLSIIAAHKIVDYDFLLNLANEIVYVYGNKNLLLKYYSRDLLASSQARQCCIEPNLKPITYVLQPNINFKTV